MFPRFDNEANHRVEFRHITKIKIYLFQVAFNVQGLCPPVFTPLNEDYSINYGVIAPYAKFLADNGIKSVLGIFILFSSIFSIMRS